MILLSKYNILAIIPYAIYGFPVMISTVIQKKCSSERLSPTSEDTPEWKFRSNTLKNMRNREFSMCRYGLKKSDWKIPSDREDIVILFFFGQKKIGLQGGNGFDL